MISLDIDTRPIHSAIGTVTDSVGSTVADTLDTVVPAAKRTLRRATRRPDHHRRNRVLVGGFAAIALVAALVYWYQRRSATDGATGEQPMTVPTVAGRAAA